MKTQIKRLKQDLKATAKQIKELKSHRKDRQADGTPGSGFVMGLAETRYMFRHKHVAYCLARGRTLEQVDSGAGLNMKYVEWILASMQPESKLKLYVIVNETLHPSQQAVQAGHAVAEFLKKNPHTQWDNGHLIYLKAAPNYGGDVSSYGPWLYGIGEWARFREPDLKDKQTAVAVFAPDAEALFKNYKLV